MTRKFLLLAIIVAGCQLAAWAQPGFLGKKNIVQYNFYGMVGGLSGGGPYFHNSHALTYNRVVSRRCVVGVGGNFLPTSFNSIGLDQTSDGTVSVRSVGLVLQSKWYPFIKKGWIAPLGPFFRLAMQVTRVSSTWQSEDDPLIEEPFDSHIDGGFQIETGYSGVIGRRLYWDLGFRFGLTAFGRGYLELGPWQTVGVGRAIHRSELIKIDLGLGFLL